MGFVLDKYKNSLSNLLGDQAELNWKDGYTFYRLIDWLPVCGDQSYSQHRSRRDPPWGNNNFSRQGLGQMRVEANYIYV